MRSEIRYYVKLALRRSWILVVAAVLGVAASWAALQNMPSEYSSSAILLVEEAQIADSLATSTVETEASEQLDIISRRLLTRANLIAIAREFSVYENIGGMAPDAIVAGMQRQTSILQSGGGRRGGATILSVSFSARSAQIAATVANRYVTLILEESVKYRTDRAEKTEQFFRQEVQKLSEELDEKSAEILIFKSTNSDALPESYEHRLARLDQLQVREAEYERELLALNDQLARLDNPDEDEPLTPLNLETAKTNNEARLVQLQQELADASAIYSETNPRIKMLKSRIDILEEIVAESNPLVGVAIDDSSVSDAKKFLDTQIAFFNNELVQLREEISFLQGTIEQTSTVSIELDALERRYDNTQQQYYAALDRLSRAQTGERIELLAQGQRVTVVEQAAVPDKPSSPNKAKIYILGLGASVGLGIALIAVIELLNAAIRRPKDLVDALGITPLAVLPYLPTARSTRNKRILKYAAVAFVLLAIPAGLALVHQYYLPLDLLVEKVVSKLSA